MLKFDDTQLRAVRLCTTVDVQHRIVSITGQAGTGKTSILQEAYQQLASMGHHVALCAPTGKAARRITEATGIPAVTLHRLLEYPFPGERDPDTGKALIPGQPRRDKFNRLDHNIVFVDEAMMINYELFRNLVDAMPQGGAIRWFGDVNQLPPIESTKRLQHEPSSFERMLDQFPAVVLDTIYRQDEGSGIISNGELILKGRIPKRLDDFTMDVTSDPVPSLVHYISERDESEGFNRLDNQIICPTKKGWVGTHKLNTLLQSHYNPNPDSVKLERHPWNKENPVYVAVGDKVLWTQNNYDLEVFNGEVGIIREIDEAQQILIDWGDREVLIPPFMTYSDKSGREREYNPQRDLDLAYAITTHKSQGSEYQTVLYIMNGSRPFLLNRNNFYTGITRARQQVHVITDQKALSASAKIRRIF